MSKRLSLECLILPSIFASLLWIYFLFPKLVEKEGVSLFTFPSPIISYPFRYFSGTNFDRPSSTAIKELLPIVPETLYEAWSLGRLYEKRKEKPEEFSSEEAAEILNLKKKTILWKDMERIQAFLLHTHVNGEETHDSVYHRVMGTLTFINFVWVLTIVGISSSIGFVFQRIFRSIYFFFQILVIQFRFIIEVLIYIVLLFITTDGIRFNDPITGLFVSLLGASLTFPLLFLTCYLHSFNFSPRMRSFCKLIMLWISLIFTPLAIFYQSNLVGFLSTAGLYILLSFLISNSPLDLVFEKDARDSKLIKSSFGSTIILILFASVRILKINVYFLTPFTAGVMIIGAIILFISLLFISSKFYSHSPFRLIVRQIPLIFAILVAILFGNVFGIISLSNTAYTFVVIFFLQKVVEINIWYKGSNIWCLIFLVSLMLYFVALFLRENPSWIVDLFDPSSLL